VVAKFLGLSEPQAAQLRELLGELQGSASELEQQIGAKQMQLEQLVNSPNPNPQAVGILFLQIQALNRQLAQAIQSFQQRFIELLTAEQRARLGAVQQAAQLQPVVGAFAALHLVLVPPAPSAGGKVGSEVE
jgi:Spy/CpxP family protein refolding chaperone